MLNRNLFYSDVARRSGLTKEKAKLAADALLETIQEALGAGKQVRVLGFGLFQVTEVQPHDVVVPVTGKKMRLPLTKKARFRPGRILLNKVNQPENVPDPG